MDVPSYDLGVLKCPVCDHQLRGARAGDPDNHLGRKPQPGDASLCVYCGALLRFTEKGTLRESSAEELDHLLPPNKMKILLKEQAWARMVRNPPPRDKAIRLVQHVPGYIEDHEPLIAEADTMEEILNTGWLSVYKQIPDWTFSGFTLADGEYLMAEYGSSGKSIPVGHLDSKDPELLKSLTIADGEDVGEPTYRLGDPIPDAAYSTPECTCPACGGELGHAVQAYTNNGTRVQPREGDAGICVHCGQLLRYKADQTLEMTTIEDLAAAGLDDVSVVTLSIMSQRIQSRKAKRESEKSH